MSILFLGQVALKPAHHAAPSKKETDMLLYTNNKCPECQTQFGSKEEVSDHFQEIKPAKSTVSFTYVLLMCSDNYIVNKSEGNKMVYQWSSFFETENNRLCNICIRLE